MKKKRGRRKGDRSKNLHTKGRRVAPVSYKSRIAKVEKRIGQRELAKILGVSPRSVRRYKEGTRKPRKDIYSKIVQLEKKSRGYRKTKSIKKKRARAKAIVKAHPEVKYYERKQDFGTLWINTIE